MAAPRPNSVATSINMRQLLQNFSQELSNCTGKALRLDEVKFTIIATEIRPQSVSTRLVQTDSTDGSISEEKYQLKSSIPVRQAIAHYESLAASHQDRDGDSGAKGGTTAPKRPAPQPPVPPPPPPPAPPAQAPDTSLPRAQKPAQRPEPLKPPAAQAQPSIAPHQGAVRLHDFIDLGILSEAINRLKKVTTDTQPQPQLGAQAQAQAQAQAKKTPHAVAPKPGVSKKPALGPQQPQPQPQPPLGAQAQAPAPAKKTAPLVAPKKTVLKQPQPLKTTPGSVASLKSKFDPKPVQQQPKPEPKPGETSQKFTIRAATLRFAPKGEETKSAPTPAPAPVKPGTAEGPQVTHGDTRPKVTRPKQDETREERKERRRAERARETPAERQKRRDEKAQRKAEKQRLEAAATAPAPGAGAGATQTALALPTFPQAVQCTIAQWNALTPSERQSILGLLDRMKESSSAVVKTTMARRIQEIIDNSTSS